MLFIYMSAALNLRRNHARSLQGINASTYYEVAIIIDKTPKHTFQTYLLNRAEEFAEDIREHSPSHPTVTIWDPVYAAWCPHTRPKPSIYHGKVFPEPYQYWRGSTLAHYSTWNDFCIYRENAQPNDTLVVFENDVLCLADNCAAYLDHIVQTQVVDVVYLGWCNFVRKWWW